MTELQKYPVTYKDRHGRLKTYIETDGSTIYINVRGIKFTGHDFESLQTINGIDNTQFDYLIAQNGSAELTNFDIEVHFGINIVHTDSKKSYMATLIAHIRVSHKLNSTVGVELDTEFDRYNGLRHYDSFENALNDLQSQLPQSYKIKTCLSCRYSNYSPYGNGLFGELYCFRNLKKLTKLIAGKQDLLDLWDEADKSNLIFNVQETYVCMEHDFVRKNDWTYKA